jgi:hypothetical protein
MSVQIARNGASKLDTSVALRWRYGVSMFMVILGMIGVVPHNDAADDVGLAWPK